MDVSVNYEVIRLAKAPGNRLCADCKAALINHSHTYASRTFGVWVCSQCGEVHDYLRKNQSGSFPGADKFVKAATAVWSANELAIMVRAGNNEAINKVLERYVPTQVWSKIPPTASREERIHWIRAKYYSHMFMIPQEIEKIRPLSRHHYDSSEREERIEHQKLLPTRVVDFFIVLGPGRNKAASRSSTTAKPITSLDQLTFNVDILDCYPDKRSYPDTPIPELLGAMVFPEALTFVLQEKAPTSYSYVLTDINRVKLYGTSLIFYELVEPAKLKEMTTGLNLSQELRASLADKVLYITKALTVLSHYPFYQLFALFLQQIYHVSLSTAPLPIERYVVNFMQELPLPPKGRVEILFSMPEKLLNLTRPPKNQLPMVDFSYRPLFAMLSVENIMTVFACLCLELSVCICANNVALLTPVQEALLSFLYPFVWQGCYVPILPANLMELLDAPVPLLVGVHDSYLMQTPCSQRSMSVLFVHLDTDTLSFGERNDGNGDTARHLPTLPKATKEKLRGKLKQFGGCIYHSSWLEACQVAGTVFLNNEHLSPIQTFIVESGIIANNYRYGMTSHDMASHYNKLGIRGQTPTKHLGGEAAAYRHPAAATMVTSSSSSSSLPGNGNGHGAVNILDVENNYSSSELDDFNAREVRDAFFRFFVASFIDYQNFFKSDLPSLDNKKKRIIAFTATHRQSSANNLQSIAGSDAMSDVGGSVVGGMYFSSKEYVATLQDEFLGNMVKSQMFSNFIHEKQESPNLPEIRFFDENILAKKNRSRFTMNRITTPFLSDEADFFRETFTVPAPSIADIPSGSRYSYPCFPTLDPALLGVPRKPNPLVEAPEMRRLRDDVGAISLLHQAIKANAERWNTNRSISTESMMNALQMESAGSAFGSIRGAQRVVGGGGGGGGGGGDSAELEEFFEYSRLRALRFRLGISQLQSLYRSKNWRVFNWYYRLKRAIRKVARFYKAKSLSLAIWKRVVWKFGVRLQAAWRRFYYQNRFKKIIQAIALWQSRWRCFRIRQQYLRFRSNCVKAQARVRGHVVRWLQLGIRSEELKRRRLQAMYLWCLERTALQYRSVFWMEVDQPSYLHLALYQDELMRLYDSLGCAKAGTACFVRDFEHLAFAARFQAVQALPLISKVTVVSSMGISLKEMAVKLDQMVTDHFHGTPKFDALRIKEMQDRQHVYDVMKAQQQQNVHFDSLFSLLHIEMRKRRKRKLAHYVWVGCTEEQGNISAEIVLTVVEGAEGRNIRDKDWLQAKIRERARRHCVETVHACLTSLQRAKVQNRK